MLCRSRLAVPLLALLAAALLAGCGGGEESGGSQQNGGQGQDQQQDQQQQESKKEAQETKIAVGNVIAVHPDRRRMVVQPSQQAAEGTEKVPLNVRKTAEITLGDEKAEMGDIAEGQQAQAEYIVKNEVNRAVSVQLFEAEGSPEEQPQGEDTSN